MSLFYISAEDGAVEYDLPILENHEVISRYGFPDLALVETNRGKALPDYSIKVTLPDGTFTVLQVCSAAAVTVPNAATVSSCCSFASDKEGATKKALTNALGKGNIALDNEVVFG